MSSNPNNVQIGGNHYQKHGNLQHWDVVQHFGLDYFQGQITKYVMRWRDKGGLQDLKKAAHFLEKYIALQATFAMPAAHVQTCVCPVVGNGTTRVLHPACPVHGDQAKKEAACREDELSKPGRGYVNQG